MINSSLSSSVPRSHFSQSPIPCRLRLLSYSAFDSCVLTRILCSLFPFFKRFLEDDLEALYPLSAASAHASLFQPTLRVLSHPFRALPDSPAVDMRFRHLTLHPSIGGREGGKEGGRQRPRLLLAIGPESGWDVSLRI